MIRVDVNLVPYGYQPDELIGTITIANDGTGTHDVGNYVVRAATHDPQDDRRMRLVAPVGEVSGWFGGFPRQDKNVLHLLRDALNAALPSEPTPTNAELVKAFMVAMDQQMAPSPTSVVSTSVQNLRYDLIAEELAEFLTAQVDNDVVGIADALADLLYVVYGAAHTYGIPIDAIFSEVHRSNMSKLGDDGRPVLRPADGKVMKGPNYSAPALEPILGIEDAFL